MQEKIFFYSEGGDTSAQVAQRSGRRSVPGNILGQIGLGSEQPAYCREVDQHDL